MAEGAAEAQPGQNEAQGKPSVSLHPLTGGWNQVGVMLCSQGAATGQEEMASSCDREVLGCTLGKISSVKGLSSPNYRHTDCSGQC